MNRADHLQWCKDRANEYLDRHEIADGITSMMSDLGKHPETAVPPVIGMLGLKAVMDNDLEAARRFVDGFN